ncbi:hypothetical protein CBQ26_02005 [Deinococcus indicus]|uniref:ABC transporter ATP-binding protein n=1 Tax=Deinococcus indicus TaxID=223556 RepID=A0A246BS25_9DEIO|nr:ABC transporter ATP-binding protein [Deinococcus indicus]OWL93672.1 hypothetical protein CBQ26_18910 [Deinococcus indicus]OWL98475.1 hypothetical protein CBQ26_02005 [Deinococcus indicus]
MEHKSVQRMNNIKIYQEILSKNIYVLSTILIIVIISGILPYLVADSMRVIASPQTSSAEAMILISRILVFGTIYALAIAASGFLKDLLSLRITNYLNNLLIDKTIHLSLEYFESNKSRDDLFKAQREMSSRPLSIFSNILSISQNTVIFIVFLVSLYKYFDIYIISIGIPIYFSIYLSKRSVKFNLLWHDRIVHLARFNSYLDSLLTSRHSKTELRAYKAEQYFQNKVKHSRDESEKLNKKLSIASFLYQNIGIILVILVEFALIYGYTKNHAKVNAGDLIFILTAFSGLHSNAIIINSSLSTILEDRKFFEFYIRYLNIEESHPIQCRQSHFSEQKGIEVRDISFSYPDAEAWAIRNLSISIRDRESIAIVGENGSGKTTLGKLLSGLFAPSSGVISLSSAYENDFRVGVMFQDFGRYNFTIKENILLAYSQESDSKIIKLMEDTKFFDNFQNDAANMIVGREFDPSGIDLSGGQWQKLAFTRLLYDKWDLIVMDEPTSSLDANSEAAFLSKVQEILKDQITVIITHRLALTKYVDRILYLENGEIVEQGGHIQLMEKKGRYYSMYLNQIKSYDIDRIDATINV